MRTSTIIFTALSSLSFAAASPATGESYFPVKAIATLAGEKVKGTVTLFQESFDDDTVISYEITGNDANAQRGFHIHQLGDLTKGCASTASHYNPYNKAHGAPKDFNRHIGDLGNIKTDATGLAKGNITDRWIKLYGPTSVIGRAFVVHAGVDDLGKGTVEDSKTTGNAGGRNACGVIGLAA
jgi:Cu-Zn family superoxide dismutase